MSNSAKVVLWMGFFMIAFGVVKNWGLISATIFGTNSGGSLIGPGGIKPINGKCPTGSVMAYGRCWNGITDPIPPTRTSA